MTAVAIHTHDRITLKRCRRKWSWESPLRGNLVVAEGRPNKNLWFGSGWHFAMEDYHGYRRFARMRDAFAGYVYAHTELERPYEWEQLLDLGKRMADYYTGYWLPRHDEFRTLWLGYDHAGQLVEAPPGPVGCGSVPQVEVPYSLTIDGHDPAIAMHEGTLDGVLIDGMGRWWIKEIKTASRIDTEKLDNDPQITAYCLAAAEFYEHDFEGVVYMQFLKRVPQWPVRSEKTGRFSMDKRNPTTYAIYRRALIDTFGHVPPEYSDYLDYLVGLETAEGNGFIRVDYVRRNQANIVNERWKLACETRDMLDPDLLLYPSPTRDCAWDCDFKGACLACDDGADYEHILATEFMQRNGYYGDQSWRGRVRYPDEADPADEPLDFDWLVPLERLQQSESESEDEIDLNVRTAARG